RAERRGQVQPVIRQLAIEVDGPQEAIHPRPERVVVAGRGKGWVRRVNENRLPSGRRKGLALLRCRRSRNDVERPGPRQVDVVAQRGRGETSIELRRRSRWGTKELRIAKRGRGQSGEYAVRRDRVVVLGIQVPQLLDAECAVRDDPRLRRRA